MTGSEQSLCQPMKVILNSQLFYFRWCGAYFGVWYSTNRGDMNRIAAHGMPAVAGVVRRATRRLPLRIPRQAGSGVLGPGGWSMFGGESLFDAVRQIRVAERVKRDRPAGPSGGPGAGARGLVWVPRRVGAFFRGDCRSSGAVGPVAAAQRVIQGFCG